MNIEIDTHAHTLVSGHAYNTIREMAQMAAEKGLKGLALTEHAPAMPGSTNLYYFQNLRIVPREMYGVKLLLGTELNILDDEGNVDLPENVVKSLDIAIASIHPLCFQEAREKVNIMSAYRNAMEHPWIDIIGHPDDGRYPVDYEELVNVAKRTGTLLEVNNSSLKPGGYRKNTSFFSITLLNVSQKHCYVERMPDAGCHGSSRYGFSCGCDTGRLYLSRRGFEGDGFPGGTHCEYFL